MLWLIKQLKQLSFVLNMLDFVTWTWPPNSIHPNLVAYEVWYMPQYQIETFTAVLKSKMLF